MPVTDAVMDILKGFWWIPIVLIVVSTLQLPQVRGAIGEWRVHRRLKRSLDSAQYRVFSDVLLKDSRGTTQIDHIVVCEFGLFVIETKQRRGVIEGSLKAKQWVQRCGRRRFQFQNPLHQNYRHIKAAEAVLRVPNHAIEELVVFVGSCRLRQSVPGVVRGKALINTIRQHQTQRIDQRDVERIGNALQEIQESTTSADRRQHVNTLKLTRAR